MSTKIIRIVIVLFLFVSLFGCSKKENKNLSESKQSQSLTDSDAYKGLEKFNVGNEKINLQYQFKKGEKFSYKLTTFSSVDQNIQADSLIKRKSNQTLTYMFDISVLNVDKNNIAELGVTVSSVNINANDNGKILQYDSKTNNSKENKMQFFEYETILHSQYHAKVNQKGVISEITEVSKMVDKLANVLQQMYKKPVTADQKVKLSNDFIESEIRPVTQLLFKEVPAKIIAKDSTWARRYPGSMAVFQLDNNANYKVYEFVKFNNAKAAKVGINLVVKSSGQKQVTENGVTYNFEDPKIAGDGIVFYNIENGRVLKSETSTKVEMNVQMTSKDSSQKLKKTTRKDISVNKSTVELL
jgi:hypothetical protein